MGTSALEVKDIDPKDIKPREPYAKRAETGGNELDIPPDQRKPGDAYSTALDAASQAVSISAAALSTAVAADALLKSDPRHERDQEVYKAGQMGRIIPLPGPSSEPPPQRVQIVDGSELGAARPPVNAKEQVERDRERLQAMNNVHQARTDRLNEINQAGADATAKITETVNQTAQTAKEESDKIADRVSGSDSPLPAANQPVTSPTQVEGKKDEDKKVDNAPAAKK